MESRGIFREPTRNLGIKWNFRLIPNHVVENLKWNFRLIPNHVVENLKWRTPRTVASYKGNL